MPTVSDIANVQISLSATPPSTASFGISCLLVDDTNVPIDKRQIQVTRADYATSLTSGTDAYSWCSTLWGQTLSPEKAYIGRWVSAATGHQFIMPDYNTTLATWTAVTDGDIRITDGTNNDDLTGLDFSSATSLADVAQVIETAMQAIAAPNITGIDTATIELDPLDRMVLTHSVTGSTSPTISLVQLPAGAGTDISVAGFLSTATGFAQVGLDAEGLDDALAAVLAKTNEPFSFCERGGSISQKVDFATAINAQAKLGFVVVNDTDAKDSGATTDAGYLINALGYNKVRVLYHEDSTVNPDAAECGNIMTYTEGARHFALWELQGVPKSGLDTDGTTVKEMTASEISALTAKGYDYYSKPSTIAHAMTGLASGGNEFRIMFAKLYTEAQISAGVYGYMVAQNVVTFSDTDIQAVKGIIDYWLTEMVSRKVLDPGYTITMPLASDFTAAVKATHIMDLDNVAEADAQIAVNKINITLTWNV
jgi:hypothetical protein